MNALYKTLRTLRCKSVFLASLLILSAVPGLAQQTPPAKKRPTLGSRACRAEALSAWRMWA